MTVVTLDKLSVLKQASFGERIAEEEMKELGTYFVETDQWRQLVAGKKDIVYGAKGSGKSALYSLLLQEAGRTTRSRYPHCPG